MILRKKSLIPLLTASALTVLSLSKVQAEDQPQRTLTEQLFTAESPEEFHKVLLLARKSKVPKQVLLEARFIHNVDNSDNHALAALSEDLLPLLDSFDSNLSQIFTLEDDWKAIVKYTLALKNLEMGHSSEFKKNITEAFWLSPRQASAFAPHVEKFKLEMAMKSVLISPESSQKNLLSSKNEKVLAPNQKTHILFFWSPWSREFSETLLEFKKLCSEAKKNNITIRAIIAEHSDEVNLDAINFIKESKITDSALWLIEEPSLKLSTALRIQSIPTVVIVDNLGKVKFNGHPSDLISSSTLHFLTPKK